MTGGRPLLIGAMPFLFILTWASGFPVTRLGLEYAEPFTILWIRSSVVVVCAGAYALAVRLRFPPLRELLHIAVVGITLQCLYLGSMFMALDGGVSQGVAALIAGMQPILTAAAVGVTLGEKVTVRQWAGFLLGFVGLAVVVSERMGVGIGTAQGFFFAALTPIFITAASLYQKKFCAQSDLRVVMIVQQAAAGFCNFWIAMATETGGIEWGGGIVFTLVYLAIVLTVAANSLYYLMLRHGEAARVSSLFYLTPPTAVLLGWITYNETMGAVALAGFAIAVAGVFLVTRSR
jgi:drug/metabolite transporter (DMT)-like permease